jgi:hypothetical protein
LKEHANAVNSMKPREILRGGQILSTAKLTLTDLMTPIARCFRRCEGERRIRSLGFDVGRYDDLEAFGHGGDDAGFNANLIMFADTGKGVAIMTNFDNGSEVYQQLVRSVAREYGWPTPRENGPLPLPRHPLAGRR